MVTNNTSSRQVVDIIDSILKEDDERPANTVRDLLQSRHNITLGLRTVRKAVHDLGWTFGKPGYVRTITHFLKIAKCKKYSIS